MGAAAGNGREIPQIDIGIRADDAASYHR